MAAGFQIFKADGSVLYDVTSIGFTLLDAISLVTGQGTGSKGYPEMPGYEVLFTQVSNAPFGDSSIFHSISVNYSAGYPVVTWTLTSNNAGTTLYIFAR